MSPRATSKSAKTARREVILEAAGESFDRLGFAATSMSRLAAQAGLAKGTLYLYFPTKEAVFLALYLRELDAWFADINTRVEKAGTSLAASRLAGLLVDALGRRPRLPPLAAILHTVLERNIGEADARAFKQHLLVGVGNTGIGLEARVTFLAPGDGARLLLRFHALVIGCWHAATPAPIARRVLEREVLAPLRIDFSEELENTLVLLLEGWRHSGGGF